jgi:hypothetical protein
MQNLIQTAKLTHTFYSPERYNETILQQLTHGYFRNMYDETSMNESWLRSAGALLSTPSDMCLWMRYMVHSKVRPINKIKFTRADEENDNSGSIQFFYGGGIFKRNSKIGDIYFTPGLSSGYVSMMGYIPSKNIYFAYSTSYSPVLGLHKYLLSSLIKVFEKYK